MKNISIFSSLAWTKNLTMKICSINFCNLGCNLMLRSEYTEVSKRSSYDKGERIVFSTSVQSEAIPSGRECFYVLGTYESNMKHNAKFSEIDPKSLVESGSSFLSQPVFSS